MENQFQSNMQSIENPTTSTLICGCMILAILAGIFGAILGGLLAGGIWSLLGLHSRYLIILAAIASGGLMGYVLRNQKKTISKSQLLASSFFLGLLSLIILFFTLYLLPMKMTDGSMRIPASLMSFPDFLLATAGLWDIVLAFLSIGFVYASIETIAHDDK